MKYCKHGCNILMLSSNLSNSIYKILRYGASVGSTTTSGSGMMVPKNQLKKRGVSRISRQRIYSVKNSHSGNHSESKTSQFRHIFMTLNIPCKKRLVGEYGLARKPGHTEESQVKPGAGQDCNTQCPHIHYSYGWVRRGQ